MAIERELKRGEYQWLAIGAAGVAVAGFGSAVRVVARPKKAAIPICQPLFT